MSQDKVNDGCSMKLIRFDKEINVKWQKRKTDYECIPVHYDVMNQEKQFAQYTKEETEKYFAWFIDQIPNRLKQLKKEFGRKNKKINLDMTIDSLTPLWKWYLGELEYYEFSVQEIRDWSMKLSREDILILLNIPFKLSPYSWSCGMDIAIYMGEMLIRQCNHLSWGVISDKKYSSVNQPVLVGLSEEKPAPYINTVEVLGMVIGCPMWTEYSGEELKLYYHGMVQGAN